MTTALVPERLIPVAPDEITGRLRTTKVIKSCTPSHRRAAATLFIGRKVDIIFAPPGHPSAELVYANVTVEGVGTEEHGAWRDVIIFTEPPHTSDLARMRVVSLAIVRRIVER